LKLKNLKINAVIVCYEPDISNLSQLCSCLVSSNCEVILVDNSEKSKLSDFKHGIKCKVIMAGGNTGIAYAQNIGIKYAIRNNAEVVVFFDQDSKIDNDFMTLLMEPLEANIPCIVAPQYYAYDTKFEYPSFRMNKFGLIKKVFPNGATEPYPVDIVISSGSAATVDVFKVAGFMDEDLYIDFVDTEWCLRCRRENIPILLVPKALMRHSIGDGAIKFYFLTIIIHNPTRCYYQIRNGLHLFRKKSVPVLYAAKEFLSVLVNKLLLLFFVKNKLDYFSSYALGVYHGIAGITGKRNS